MKKVVFIAVVIWVSLCPALIAGQDKMDFELTADFFSKYVWRGQLLNDDYVFQTGLKAEYKGFTLGAWTNMDLTKYTNNRGEFTEWDFSLDYSGNFGESKLGYFVGVVRYQYPSSVADTTELYWGLTYDCFLSPTLTVYHDIDEVGGGTYANFAVSHTIKNIINLTENVPVDMVMGASIGGGNSEYNAYYWNNADNGWKVNRTALNDLALTVSFPFELSGGWTITPSLNYVTLVDGRIRKMDTYATGSTTKGSDYFFTGIGISKKF